MGFFSGNGSFQDSTSAEYEVAEPGSYLCRLIEIEASEQPDFNDPTVMKPIYIWKFETIDQFDSNDKAFRFTKFTGRAYGNEKANLTILFDQMFGRRLSRQEFAELDIEQLMESQWRVMVDEVKTKTDKIVNKVMSVRPASRKGVVMDAPVKPMPAKPKPVVKQDDDVEDPFA